MSQDSTPVDEITAFLDSFLRIAEVPDSAHALNGLQVECRRPIGQIVAGRTLANDPATSS